MKNLSELFAALRQPQHGRDAAAMHDECLSCGADLRESETYRQVRVCHACRFHYTIRARARIEELAGRRRLPLIVVLASGGARMQEGPLALMQMGKIAVARERLAASRAPMLCVLTNPTLGASYSGIGALGDYVVAEPNALIGYA